MRLETVSEQFENIERLEEWNDIEFCELRKYSNGFVFLNFLSFQLDFREFKFSS